MSTPVRPFRSTVAAPVRLGHEDPDATLEFVAWLRDRHTQAHDVSWSAIVGPGFDTSPLHHLPPPGPAPGAALGAAPGAAVQWREAYRPGMCYYRVGPGFIQVKDVRQPDRAAILLLDTPDLLDAFTRCLRPCRLDELPPGERTAAAELEKERLLLRVGDLVVTLPNRMRHWPVPCNLA